MTRTVRSTIHRGPTGHRCGMSHHAAKADDHEVYLAIQLREQYGLSYGAIAEKLERPRPTIVSWIKGDSRSLQGYHE